jgi:signal transduction histidine kinase
MISHSLQSTFIYLFIALSLLFIGLFFLFLPKKKHPYLLFFSLFLATITINLIGIWQIPLATTFSTLMKYTSYGASTFFLLFYEQIFGQGFKRINRLLWQLHLGGWALITTLSMLSIVSLEDSFFPYSVLNIVSILYIAVATIIKANSGNNDARIFTFGLIGMIVTLIFDISLAIKIANYAPSQTTTWGLLLFTACLTTILLKRLMTKGTDFISEPLIFHQNPIELKMKADSMVMHTLKTEISRLLYLNERNKRLIATMKDGEKLEKNFESMDESLQHMNDMILAIKKTDDLSLKLQKAQFTDVIKEAVQTFQSGLLQKPITVDIDIDAPIQLEIDSLHIKECITNILVNSMDAIEHDHGKIQIKLFRKNKTAILAITDNGKGIHPDHLNDVVSPLFTTKKTAANYGIGLYYVYFVVNKHGGTLSIPFSEVGKGTTIQIQLPIKTKQAWSVNFFEKNKSHAG